MLWYGRSVFAAAAKCFGRIFDRQIPAFEFYTLINGHIYHECIYSLLPFVIFQPFEADFDLFVATPPLCSPFQ